MSCARSRKPNQRPFLSNTIESLKMLLQHQITKIMVHLYKINRATAKVTMMHKEKSFLGLWENTSYKSSSLNFLLKLIVNRISLYCFSIASNPKKIASGFVEFENHIYYTGFSTQLKNTKRQKNCLNAQSIYKQKVSTFFTTVGKTQTLQILCFDISNSKQQLYIYFYYTFELHASETKVYLKIFTYTYQLLTCIQEFIYRFIGQKLSVNVRKEHNIYIRS